MPLQPLRFASVCKVSTLSAASKDSLCNTILHFFFFTLPLLHIDTLFFQQPEPYTERILFAEWILAFQHTPKEVML